MVTSMARAGTLCFMVTFIAGFVLGTVRQLVVAPVAGEAAAVALEAPFMLVVAFVAARWVVSRYRLPPKLDVRAGVGLIALTLLLSTEVAAAGALRGWTVSEWIGHFGTPAGMLSLLLFLLFAAMPTILLTRQSRTP